VADEELGGGDDDIIKRQYYYYYYTRTVCSTLPLTHLHYYLLALAKITTYHSWLTTCLHHAVVACILFF
jgi:hypothetical protein